MGIGCPNEDHGSVVRFDVGRMRWRPAQSADKMRRGFGGRIKSVGNTRSSRTGNGDGPEQRLLWYGSASTNGAAARVVIALSDRSAPLRSEPRI
jgi:hypothetical protein